MTPTDPPGGLGWNHPVCLSQEWKQESPALCKPGWMWWVQVHLWPHFPLSVHESFSTKGRQTVPLPLTEPAQHTGGHLAPRGSEDSALTCHSHGMDPKCSPWRQKALSPEETHLHARLTWPAGILRPGEPGRGGEGWAEWPWRGRTGNTPLPDSHWLSPRSLSV